MTIEPVKKAAVKPGAQHTMKTDGPDKGAPDKGAPNKNARAFDGVSTSDYSAYVFDHTKVFLRAAQARDLKFLTYLLEMVAVEAARLRDEL